MPIRLWRDTHTAEEIADVWGCIRLLARFGINGIARSLANGLSNFLLDHGQLSLRQPLGFATDFSVPGLINAFGAEATRPWELDYECKAKGCFECKVLHAEGEKEVIRVMALCISSLPPAVNPRDFADRVCWQTECLADVPWFVTLFEIMEERTAKEEGIDWWEDNLEVNDDGFWKHVSNWWEMRLIGDIEFELKREKVRAELEASRRG